MHLDNVFGFIPLWNLDANFVFNSQEPYGEMMSSSDFPVFLTGWRFYLPSAGLFHRAADQWDVQDDGGVQLGQFRGGDQPVPRIQHLRGLHPLFYRYILLPLGVAGRLDVWHVGRRHERPPCPPIASADRRAGAAGLLLAWWGPVPVHHGQGSGFGWSGVYLVYPQPCSGKPQYITSRQLPNWIDQHYLRSLEDELEKQSQRWCSHRRERSGELPQAERVYSWRTHGLSESGSAIHQWQSLQVSFQSFILVEILPLTGSYIHKPGMQW